MIFVELPGFVAFRENHWSDEDLRLLQSHLVARPDAGDIIPGSRGLRKLRWAVSGRGKRGGARVIYCWVVADDLIYAYAKSVRDDLTPEQINTPSKLMKDLANG